MNHKKTYHAKIISSALPGREALVIEGPIPGEQVARYFFHEDLKAFRIPSEQQEALVEIADLPEGRIVVARDGEMIVGYVTYHYPDPLERWSEGNIENLIELGAIEVVPAYRGNSIGTELLRVSMMDDAMEDYIVMTTEYYWHWDLKGTGLDAREYRKVMEKMMNAGGLEWYATDDPEICAHPANCLMARIGKRVDSETFQRFDRLRFINRFMY